VTMSASSGSGSAQAIPVDGVRSARLAGPRFAATACLMALLFLLPVSNNGLRISVFALAVLATAVWAIGNRPHPLLRPRNLAPATFFLLLGLWFGLWGLLRGNPGAVFASAVFAFWPIVYQWILVGLTVDEVRRILRILVWTTAISGVIVVSFVLTYRGHLPDFAIFTLYPDVAYVEHDGYVQMRFYAISTMVFAVPFLIATFVVPPAAGPQVCSARVRTIALIGGLAVAAFAGRRALWIVIALSPFVALVLATLASTGADTRRALLRRFGAQALASIMVALPVLAYLLGDTLAGAMSFLYSAFTPESDVDGNVRLKQSTVLLRGWLDSPAFGHGLGAVADQAVRDEERTWEYELQYHLLLFTTGIVGFTAYLAGVGWIVVQGLHAAIAAPRQAAVVVPCLSGLVCFVIANATNPYLQAYGHLWTLFLPYALIVAIRDHPDSQRAKTDRRDDHYRQGRAVLPSIEGQPSRPGTGLRRE